MPRRIDFGHILGVLGIAFSLYLYLHEKCDSFTQQSRYLSVQINELSGKIAGLRRRVEEKVITVYSLRRLATDLEKYILESDLREEVEALHGSLSQAVSAARRQSISEPSRSGGDGQWNNILLSSGLNPYGPVSRTVREIHGSTISAGMQNRDFFVAPEVAEQFRDLLRQWLRDREDLGAVNNDLESRLIKVPLYEIRRQPPPGRAAALIINDALGEAASELHQVRETLRAYETEIEKHRIASSAITAPSFCRQVQRPGE